MGMSRTTMARRTRWTLLEESARKGLRMAIMREFAPTDRTLGDVPGAIVQPGLGMASTALAFNSFAVSNPIRLIIPGDRIPTECYTLALTRLATGFAPGWRSRLVDMKSQV